MIPFDPVVFGIELLFMVVAVLFCFVIYIKTKEIYELSKYEGLMYFRNVFLFFGLSYFMRFLFSLLIFSTVALDVIIPRHTFMPIFILPLGYFSTIGIFYLIFSLIWKRFDNRSMLIWGHGIAILLSLLSFITRSPMILLWLQSALLIIFLIMSLFMHHGKKKISQLKILYLLVFVLWLINLWLIYHARPSFHLHLLPYLVSLAVFIAIYYKISKWVK